METAEKAYFTRHLSYQPGSGEPTDYVKLFNALDRMKEYDPKKLQRKFKEDKILNNLPASFSFLYKSLLNSLVNYRTKKDDVLTAYEMLSEIRILFQKRLYAQCERQIRRARRHFEEREYYRYLYLLASYEYSLTVGQMQQDEITEVRQITKERRAYLRKLDDELLIFDICDQLRRYHRKKQLNPNQDFTPEVTDITQQLKELKSRLETGSTTFKLSYMRATERLYYLKNQQIESLHAAHRYVRFRRDLPKTLRFSDSADLDAIDNHITKSIAMWFVDEVEYWLPELTVIHTQEKNLRHRIDLLHWHFHFQVLLMRGQFEGLADLVSRLMDDLDILLKKNVVYYRVLLFKDLALYHFLTGDFQESLEWTKRVIEQKDTDEWVRKLRVNMYLLEIMAHFNLNNYQLVLSLCRSFERSVKKIQHADNEFVEELKWVRGMKRLEKYVLPGQMNDFIKTFLPESCFALPPNYRVVLISVWAKAHHDNISLREAWLQHAEDITAEMKATTGMEVLCFAGQTVENPIVEVVVSK